MNELDRRKSNLDKRGTNVYRRGAAWKADAGKEVDEVAFNPVRTKKCKVDSSARQRGRGDGGQ